MVTHKHQFADVEDVELNFESAKILTNEFPNLNIKIRPHVNGHTGIGQNESSNPEYLINGQLADRKRFYLNNYENTFKKAMNQDNKKIVLSIEEGSMNKAVNSINGLMKDHSPL